MSDALPSPIPASTHWTLGDIWGAFRSRMGAFRMAYTVQPGLYAVGSPGPDSEIMVTANYKLSFDHLRLALKGMHAWILVLETRGINVWCAAGKGKFGTFELMKRLRLHQMDERVTHRRVILPQLGAPGVVAHRAKKETGFHVHYGPVRAADLPAYLAQGRKADKPMRQVRFSFLDRLVLIPMELLPALPLALGLGLVALTLTEVQPHFWTRIPSSGLLPETRALLVHLGLSLVSGTILGPLFLPWIPGVAFSAKGWLLGLLVSIASVLGFPSLMPDGFLLSALIFGCLPFWSSFLLLQFTGSTTFTHPSGVQVELRFALPLFRFALGIGFLLLLANNLASWGRVFL